MENLRERLEAKASRLKNLRKEIADLREEVQNSAKKEGGPQWEGDTLISMKEATAEQLEVTVEALREQIAVAESPRQFGPDSPQNRYIRAKFEGKDVKTVLSAEEIETHIKDAPQAGHFMINELRNDAGVSPHDESGSPLVPVQIGPIGRRYTYYGGPAQLARQTQAGRTEIRIPLEQDAAFNAAADAPIQVLKGSTGISSKNAADLGEVSFLPKLFSHALDVTESMVRSSGFDVYGWVAGRNRRAIGMSCDNWFTNATPAANTTVGGVKGLAVTAETAGSGALTFDEIMDLYFNTPVIYREYSVEGEFGYQAPGQGSVGWLVSAAVEKLIANLKVANDDNRRVVNPDLRMAISRSFLGFPMRISNTLASGAIAAGQVPVIFGDWGCYQIYNFGGESMKMIQDTATSPTDSWEVRTNLYRDAGAVYSINDSWKAEALRSLTVKA